MSELIQNLNSDNFNDVIGSNKKPVLVDFWAPWCGPCRAIAPELSALAEELKDQAIIAKVNVDDQPELAQQYGIQSIPNLIVFRDGKPTHQLVGFHDRKFLKEALI